VHAERGAAFLAVPQQGEQGMEGLPVLGGQKIQRCQLLQGAGLMLQILGRRRIGLGDPQGVGAEHHHLGGRFLQDGLEQGAFVGRSG